MYSPLSPPVFVERLIEAEAPIWFRWDRDELALLQALFAVAHREFSSQPPVGANQYDLSHLSLRRTRLLWLLDRLAPESDAELFEPYRSHELAIYAWGRRLPQDRRDELTRFPVTPATPGHWTRRMVLQALIFAWCDSCPDDNLNSILDWSEHWRPVLEFHDVCWLPHPEDEFYRRCTDIEARRQSMIVSLRRNLTLLNNPDNTTHELAHRIAFRLWTHLLRDVAVQNPAAEQVHSTPEQYMAWLDSTLSLPAFSDVAELGRDLLKIRGERGPDEYVARSLWIWRHGKDNWKQLYWHSGMFRDDWISGRILDRLAEIVPPDELETWGALVLCEFKDERIRAFCRWLPPRYAEVLRDHFNHPEPDWANCAYQNYLAKAQEPVLRLRWNQVRDLSARQAELLDRRLFAPERVRPAAVIEDIQTVEGDLRLRDPFNHRAF